MLGPLEVNLILEFVVAGLRPGDVNHYCNLRLVCKSWAARFDWKESFAECTTVRISIGRNYLWERHVVFGVEVPGRDMVYHSHTGPAVIQKGSISGVPYCLRSHYFCGKFTGFSDPTQ